MKKVKFTEQDISSLAKAKKVKHNQKFFLDNSSSINAINKKKT